MPLVTATFSTGGNVVITDTVEVAAITAMTTAIAANTLAINTTMGVLGSKTPGNVATSMAVQAGMQANILKALNKIESNQQSMVLALNGLSAKMEANTKALGAIASSMQGIDIMVTTSTADQIRNNKFQQNVTNQALVDAGKEPVTVKDEEFKTVATQALADMKSMTTIQLTYKAVDKVTEMLTNSVKWSAQWALETETGKFFTDQFLKAKGYITGLFSKDIAESTVRETKAAIAEVEAGAP